MEQTNTTDSVNSEQAPTQADKDLANLINSAVSSQLKRQFAKLPELVEGILSSKSQPAQTAQPSETAPSEEKSTKQELDDLKRQLKAEKQRAREQQAITDVRAKLAPHLLPDALEVAVKVIQADQRVRVKGDAVKWVSEGVEVDLDEGIAEWVASREASYFTPAKRPNVGKSGVQVKAPVRAEGSVKQDPRAATLEALERLGLRL